MLTFQSVSGDGLYSPAVACTIGVSPAATFDVSGTVQAPGASAVAFSQTVTLPDVPTSGQLFWIVQVDASTGAVSLKQSSTEFPLPDAGSVVLYSQVYGSS